uniref:Uncharacterized protein n=1 Tax=Vespula pensylvanica TaxID=30213 RepID=A0A834KSG5_VESPE|nr:hypothetical protein H0235_013678 [Vespula pensylvanica]
MAKNDSAKPKRIERSFDYEITDKMEQFDRKNEAESTTNVFWLPSLVHISCDQYIVPIWMVKEMLNDPEPIEEQKVSIVEAQTTQERKEALPENDQEILVQNEDRYVPEDQRHNQKEHVHEANENEVNVSKPVIISIASSTKATINSRSKASLDKKEISQLRLMVKRKTLLVLDPLDPLDPVLITIIANSYTIGNGNIATSVTMTYDRSQNG